MKNQKTNFSTYLLKPEKVKVFDEAVKKIGIDVRSLAEPLDGEFIPFPSEPKEPKWLGAVRSVLQDPDNLNLEGQSSAGLLVIRRGSHTFVVAFGHGWLHINDEWVERDFGLRVALNSIPPDKVVEIRAEQVFARWHIASERAPRASLVNEFGVEFDRDVVAAMEGIPSLKQFGEHVRGGRSLQLDLPISQLAEVLDKSAQLFASDEYKKRWPEVDNVRPVSDESVVARLEAQLDSEFASGQADKRLVLFTPAQRRNDEPQVVRSYVFGRMSKNAAMRPYLLTGSWLDLLKKENLTPSVSTARESPIHLLDADGSEINKCNVFECMCYELSLDGKQFILSSGVWYEIFSDFLKRVNKAIADIGTPAVVLPQWNGAESEAEYNRRRAAPPCFLHFDSADVIFGGGYSRFEFCDFLHQKTKTLFFAKIASKSSGMSHLVEQVRRTRELFFSTDGSYRKVLAKVFKKYHPTVDADWLNARPANDDWNLCLVSLGRPKDKLPFFAKCALWRLNKDLTERGHKVSFIGV